MTNKSNTYSRLFFAALLGLASMLGSARADTKDKKNPPNILFFVMDDIGIDQMKIFGYGGADPAATPNIDTVALAGVRFRNTWSQPTCSPGRAGYFNGQFNIRTNINTAITGSDLANSQLSPYEYTTPKVLRRKNYVSGLFGKMHLSGSQLNPGTNPLGNTIMRKLGWDHFEGFLDGGPYPIDTTAGGVGGSTGNGNVYGCGFVPNKTDSPTTGADSGACYTVQGAVCEELSIATTTTPGRTCLEKGGILDPNASCQATVPANLNFTTQNAYYTGDWVINEEDGTISTLPPEDARGRGYRTKQEADRVIRWINQQSSKKPWMASIGFSAIHEPVQPPPSDLVPANSPPTSGSNCTSFAESRENATQMLEGIDHEIGRVLVEIGVATYNVDGSLNYDPKESNTVVIITGDNGTWTTSVRVPFDPTRAKGTPYQTGVWVPLVVAGPMVKSPGRQVAHMTNGTDLFTLFGELAGIDVRKAVPKSHPLDSEKMLPYLINPKQRAIRTTNFTLQGNNLTSIDQPQSPCYIASINTCTTILPTIGVCEDQGGQWFGAGGVVSPDSYTSCCQVNDYLATQGKPPAINYLSQRGIRNRDFKVVQNESQNCSGGDPELINEFYEINDAVPVPKVDRSQDNLLQSGAPALNSRQQRNYNALLKKLKALEATVVACPGDGNLDKVVNQKDLDEWAKFSATTGTTTPNGGGQSSWYDFNLDGLTNGADQQIIEDNLGKRCK